MILNPKKGSLLLNEEIFGPILPIVQYENIDEAIARATEADERQKTWPLALYKIMQVELCAVQITVCCILGAARSLIR